jgi:hypothetical protein
MAQVMAEVWVWGTGWTLDWGTVQEGEIGAIERPQLPPLALLRQSPEFAGRDDEIPLKGVRKEFQPDDSPLN